MRQSRPFARSHRYRFRKIYEINCTLSVHKPNHLDKAQCSLPRKLTYNLATNPNPLNVSVCDSGKQSALSTVTTSPAHTPTQQQYVPHNGCFGEYPLPRLTCQRLTADHRCRITSCKWVYHVRHRTCSKRPLGPAAVVAQQR